MDYELALKLKNAGFPMPNRVRFDPLGMVDLKGKDEVWIPTLEELIEACGKDLFSLTFTGETYSAGGARIIISGETPSEAVADLWLELNKI